MKTLLPYGFDTPEEKLLAARVMDLARHAQQKKETVFTDFMDRGKCTLLQDYFMHHTDLSFTFFGGNPDWERGMLALYPSFRTVNEADFPVAVLEVTSDQRFAQKSLTHRDYLGSLLGLGIDRGKTGDILLFSDRVVIFVFAELAEYIALNLERVAKTPVHVRVLSDWNGEAAQRDVGYTTATVSSLRLDAIAGAAFSLSRGKVQALIAGQGASVNWRMTHQTSLMLQEGDLLSIRGLGRVRLDTVGGQTKKGRISIRLMRYL